MTCEHRFLWCKCPMEMPTDIGHLCSRHAVQVHREWEERQLEVTRLRDEAKKHENVVNFFRGSQKAANDLHDDLQREWKKSRNEVERLRKAIAKMSHRKCWECGHVAYYLDGFAPYCLCEKCGSQDTRLIREAADAAVAWFRERIVDLEAEVEQLREKLGSLLAIIHRDGGHHTEEVGEEQSIEDAHQVWMDHQSALP